MHFACKQKPGIDCLTILQAGAVMAKVLRWLN
jgi:hypothetical protein